MAYAVAGLDITDINGDWLPNNWSIGLLLR